MTIDDIRKLREETGVGVMDARKALEESKGDIKKAEFGSKRMPLPKP